MNFSVFHHIFSIHVDGIAAIELLLNSKMKELY